MPKVDLSRAPRKTGSGYPSPFDEPCRARVRQQLGDAGGLTQFGVNLMTLSPGVWSSQRHWHTHEDEFIRVLEGEVVLVEAGGETVLRAGECAAFPAGAANGHHLQNRSGGDVVILEIGTRKEEEDITDYPDLDMLYRPGKGYVRRNGTPY
ncbi:MAG: cupin domain-containing protein [Pseudomonadota bacterium]